MCPRSGINEELREHIRCHSFSVAIPDGKQPLSVRIGHPRDLNLVRTADVAKGSFNFPSFNDFLRSFVVLKNDGDNALALHNVLEKGQAWGKPYP